MERPDVPAAADDADVGRYVQVGIDLRLARASLGERIRLDSIPTARDRSPPWRLRTALRSAERPVPHRRSIRPVHGRSNRCSATRAIHVRYSRVDRGEDDIAVSDDPRPDIDRRPDRDDHASGPSGRDHAPAADPDCGSARRSPAPTSVRGAIFLGLIQPANDRRRATPIDWQVAGRRRHRPLRGERLHRARQRRPGHRPRDAGSTSSGTRTSGSSGSRRSAAPEVAEPAERSGADARPASRSSPGAVDEADPRGPAGPRPGPAANKIPEVAALHALSPGAQRSVAIDLLAQGGRDEPGRARAGRDGRADDAVGGHADLRHVRRPGDPVHARATPRSCSSLR